MRFCLGTYYPSILKKEKRKRNRTVIYKAKGRKAIDDEAVVLKTGEQVTKILVTYKHADHTGELRAFPNAKIYIGAEDADAMELKGENIIRPTYANGAYYNFPCGEKIVEGVYMIEAKGNTKGNNIIIAEKDGLFFMIHGDVTYTDEALYENKLSIVFEDLPAARVTLDNVREFIKDHPTVYLSTHTPLGYENLENLKVVDLLNPPASKPVGEIVYKTATGKYVCGVYGYLYDPAENGNVAFEDLPEDWTRPVCDVGKENFNKA